MRGEVGRNHCNSAAVEARGHPGAIVTIDVMGTQKAIAAQIIQQVANYVLALKGNGKTLHDAVIAHVDKHLQNDFADIEVLRHTTTEKTHGRESTRCYFQMPVPW